MPTLTLYRPKAKEKYYDESNFKVFINGEQVAKLGQNDRVELQVSTTTVDIEVKDRWFSHFPKQTISIDEHTELEIYRDKYVASNYVILAIPFLSNILYFTKIFWLQISAVASYVVLIVWVLYKYYRNRDEAIAVVKV
ncbi:MAG: hypothetical protein RBS81_09140 [Tenuifilaceae bacterium]|jgi:hypothetical protein|nr:hypothetical protein [Tenuifilaceae bacterium]